MAEMYNAITADQSINAHEKQKCQNFHSGSLYFKVKMSILHNFLAAIFFVNLVTTLQIKQQ